MPKTIAVAILLVGSGAIVQAQQKINPPTGPQPLFATASIDKAGNVIFRQNVFAHGG